MLNRKNVIKFKSQEREPLKRLKIIPSSKLVLKLYQTSAETELHTDACSMDYGAILLQHGSKDGIFHPVYYASRKTTPAKEKYSS